MRLAALASHVPDSRIDAEAIITSAGGRRADAKVFTKLFGIERVAVSKSGESLTERFAPVLDSLAGFPVTTPIDALIYVHGLPTPTPPNHAPLVELSRSHPDLFASVRLLYEVNQHNCAGIFWGLEMARRLIQGRLANSVAILAGDCLADHPLSRRYVPGCTLIGDAFVALLLDAAPSEIQIDAIALRVHPEFAFGLNGSESEIRRFNQAHDEMVSDALAAIGFRWDGDEVLLAHNVNRLIWLPFCRRHRIDLDRICLHLLRDIGHCYTTDPFLLLHRLIAKRAPLTNVISLLSLGLGAYIGACRVHFSKVPFVPARKMEKNYASELPFVDSSLLS
jgi:3-oxoacyl-[acyl-carrier-protein] synthase-3